jgi:hypothetical protein
MTMSYQHQHRAPAGYLNDGKVGQALQDLVDHLFSPEEAVKPPLRQLDRERVRVRPWGGCVQVASQYGPNQAAHSEASHGGVTIQVTCTCGWERLTEVNGGSRRHGPWTLPRWLAA